MSAAIFYAAFWFWLGGAACFVMMWGPPRSRTRTRPLDQASVPSSHGGLGDRLGAGRAERWAVVERLANAPRANRPPCRDACPDWYSGHQGEWHTGHGCPDDPTPIR